MNEFEIFDEARRYYPGVKRGGKTEFANFKKKHKDWKQVLALIMPAIQSQEQKRQKSAQTGAFVPSWKHFKTWINNRCWEETDGHEHKKTTICVVCGEAGHIKVGHQWFCSRKCRMEKLGW